MAQETTDKMLKPLPAGHVKPQDPVKVYATAKNPFYNEGEEFEVHSALAAKLIAGGKATEKAPTKASK